MPDETITTYVLTYTVNYSNSRHIWKISE